MCHCNLLLFFCFLSVLCWCRRTQAKDQRSWKYALKTLPVPSGGCWAEIKKNKPFPLVFTVCCWELDFRGVSQPFKKISNWKYFFKKGEENLVKILNISSFFKLWDYMGHFKIYDLIKNSLGPALGPAVGVSSASLVSQPWSVCLTWNQNGPCKLHHDVCSQRTEKKSTVGSSNTSSFRLCPLDQLYKNL